MTSRVCIRIDAGGGFGMGHLVRMLAVAHALRDRHGVEVHFLAAGEQGVFQRAALEGVRVHMGQPGVDDRAFIDASLADLGPQVLVLDTKRDYDPQWIAALRAHCRVLVVDNPTPGGFAADAVIFPAAHLPDSLLNDPRWRAGPAKLLAGPEYVMLSQSVLPLRGVPTPAPHSAGGLPRVVVTTGGTDPKGLLVDILAWLSDTPFGVSVTGLVGEAFVHRDRLARLAAAPPPHVRLAPFQPGLLVGADVAVCQFGVTIYELMYLGVPSVMVAHTKENAEASRLLAQRYGAGVDLGYGPEVGRERLAKAVQDLLADRPRREQMAAVGRSLIDGRGHERVADMIMGR